MSINIFRPKAFVVLFLLLFCTTSCEKENLSISDSNEKNIAKIDSDSDKLINVVSKDEIPDIIAMLESYTNSKSTTSALGKIIKLNEMDVFLDRVLEVKNEGMNTNYSFEIRKKNTPINEFHQLVIPKDTSGMIGIPFIMSFFLNDEDMDAFMESGMDPKKFSARFKIYELNDFSNYVSKGSTYADTSCLEGSTGGSGGPLVEPGETWSVDFNGFTVNNTFSFPENNVSYNYTLYFEDASGVRHEAKAQATSNSVQLSSPGWPTASTVGLNAYTQSVSISTS